eukprot:7383151-Prymnesium_polylepis.1
MRQVAGAGAGSRQWKARLGQGVEDAWRLLECLPLALPVLAGFTYVPATAILIGSVLVYYYGADAILTKAIEVDESGSVTCLLKFPFANFLAEPLRSVLGWLGSMGKFSWMDGIAKRATEKDAAKQETGLRTLAGGFACFWVATSLAPCICFTVWRVVGATADGGPIVAEANALNVAYSYMLEPISLLRIRWPSLLPSLERLGEILEDPGAAVEHVLSYLGNVVRFVNFDPEFFLKGIAELSAINVALNLLKLTATYLSKLFAAADAVLTCCRGQGAREAADGVTYNVGEVVAPPERGAAEAVFAKGEMSVDGTELDLSGRSLTMKDGKALAVGLRLDVMMVKLE